MWSPRTKTCSVLHHDGEPNGKNPELEVNSDLKAQLQELNITAVKESEVGDSRKDVIFVPGPQMKSFQKSQVQLVQELEKKFNRKHVIFIAQSFLPKPTRDSYTKNKQKHPRNWQLYTTWSLRNRSFQVKLCVRGSAGNWMAAAHQGSFAQGPEQPENKAETFPGVYKKLKGGAEDVAQQ